MSLSCVGGWGREGGLGASDAHFGVVFLLVRASSHRLAPPGKGPRPHSIPTPGAASTIPLICNDFCLFCLSLSLTSLPSPRACAGTAPTPSGSVRFRFVC